MYPAFSQDLQIRAAELTDLKAVLQLRVALGATALSENALRAHWQSLDLRTQTRVVIGGGEELIGYAEVPQRQPGWFVSRIWVRADHQQQGIRSALLQVMEEQARLLCAEDSCHLLAQVWGHEVAAQWLLETSGYECPSYQAQRRC